MTNQKRDHWCFNEGIRFRGLPPAMHEPLYFLQTRGGGADNEKPLYDYKRTRHFLEWSKEQGATHIWYNWWKGYGLDHEEECMDQVAELFPICQELGLRAICYHSIGSLTLETLLPEVPEAGDWVTKTQEGNWTSCQVTHQSFRQRPCYSSPGYLKYLEKVMAKCLDAGADGIHFDNIGMQAEPEACHCERCENLFREYLQKEYGGDLGEEIFGIRDFTLATVPWYNQHNHPNKMKNAKVPHQRAWIDFKCQVLSGFFNNLTDFIKKKKPDAFVEFNGGENDGFASAFWRANDSDQYFHRAEMICDEQNAKDGLNKNGCIMGPHRSKKLSRSYGCAHTSGSSLQTIALGFCEDLACCQAPKEFLDQYDYLQFNNESLAQVAVLRERNSLAYNRFDPLEETLAMEQYLIERRIPFDFVHNSQLSNLDERYQLLIVAGAEVMADDLRDQIVNWVKAGGRVFFSGLTGRYDGYYRERRQPVTKINSVEEYKAALKHKNAFHELIGDDPHNDSAGHFVKEIEQGKVAWINKMDVVRVPQTQENWVIDQSYLMLPRNASVIDGMLHEIMPEGLGLKVNTGQSVYTHISTLPKTGEILVHLINYSGLDSSAVCEIELPLGASPKEVTGISIDFLAKEKSKGEFGVPGKNLSAESFPEVPLEFKMKGDFLCLTVKDILVHKTVIIRP